MLLRLKIAVLSGYDTVAGSIHAFRKECGVTPREWRVKEMHDEENNNI